MEVTYKNNKIGKICTDAKTAERAYGREMADKIHQRIDELHAAAYRTMSSSYTESKRTVRDGLDSSVQIGI